MKTNVIHFAVMIAAMFFFFTTNLFAQSDVFTIMPDEVAQPTEPIADSMLTAITFEKTIYDFGEVEEGTIVTQVYTFTNTGKLPLILTDVRGSCGCTVPQWPHAPVQPGETASLTVEFNSKHKSGKRNQRVTITANTAPPQTFVYLTGEVIGNEEEEVYSSEELESPTVKPEVVISPDCFAIYPNPTAEVLKLEMEENTIGQPAVITIYSKSGQLMAKREILSIERDPIEFSVGHYPSGTYIANIKVGDKEPQAKCFVVVD